MLKEVKSKERDFVAIFRAGAQPVKSLTTITFVHRFSTLMFFCYLPLVVKIQFMAVTSMVATQAYGGAFGSAALTFLIKRYKNKIA